MPTCTRPAPAHGQHVFKRSQFQKETMPSDAVTLGVLSTWSRHCASAIESIGSKSFGFSLLESLCAIAPCDSALILAYHAEGEPDVIFDAFDHPLRENEISSYVQDFYRLDPFYIHAFRRKEPSLLRMSDISPAHFTDTEYLRSYYHHSHVVDEVNFVAPTHKNIRLALSYERSMKSTRFSSDEIRLLKAFSLQVSSLLLQHWKACAQTGEERGDEKPNIRSSAIGARILTRREQEIVQLVLRGFSNLAIAGLLDISVQTIKIHRRNIYRKLNVSSLAELYSFAIDAAS